MLNRLNMDIFVYNLNEGIYFKGNPEQVRAYVEDIFEEEYEFRLSLQAKVVNGEFHLLMNNVDKLNTEQQKMVNDIYYYQSSPENQSIINKKHTENLIKFLGLHIEYGEEIL